MFKKNSLNKNINLLNKSVEKLNEVVEKSRLYDIIEITENKRKLFTRNFFSGIFKGVGISIGFYIITAIVLMFLNYIVRLNIPVIGDYISDIVEIVELNNKK